MLYYLNSSQQIFHQNAVGYGHCRLKTREAYTIEFTSVWQKTLVKNVLQLIISVLYSVVASSFFFPLLLKCHFSPFVIGLHIFYFVFFSAVLCLLWSSIPHFSMVIGFRKNYFQVTSVSCFPSDSSICFGDTNC